MSELSETVGLTLNSLMKFFLEDVVGGVERNTHPLTTSGGHRQRVDIAYRDHIQSNGNTFSMVRMRENKETRHE